MRNDAFKAKCSDSIASNKMIITRTKRKRKQPKQKMGVLGPDYHIKPTHRTTSNLSQLTTLANNRRLTTDEE